MKKTLLSLLFVAAVSSASFAQLSFGPKVGLGISTLKNSKSSFGGTTPYTAIATPIVGVVLNAQIGDYFAIRPELLFLQRGGKTEQNGTTGHFRTSYLEVPINLAVGLPVGPGKIEVFAGPAFGFGLGGKYKYEGNFSQTGSIKTKKQPTGNTGTDLYQNFLNVSLNFGLDYKFDNGLLIQLGYNLGFTNLTPHYSDGNAESHRSDNVTKASSVNIAVAYLFGGK